MAVVQFAVQGQKATDDGQIVGVTGFANGLDGLMPGRTDLLSPTIVPCIVLQLAGVAIGETGRQFGDAILRDECQDHGRYRRIPFLRQHANHRAVTGPEFLAGIEDRFVGLDRPREIQIQSFS